MHLFRYDAPEVTPSTRLDRWVPGAPFVDSIVVRSTASSAPLMKALARVTLAEVPLARVIGTLRYLPAKLGMGKAPGAVDVRQPFLSGLLSGDGSLLLEWCPDEIILGSVGKLHQIRDQEPVPVKGPAEFLAFRAPGHEKLAMSLRAIPAAGGALLVLEHRTLPTDAEAARRFARYWKVIRPGGAFVSRELLRAVARRAERGSSKMIGDRP